MNYTLFFDFHTSTIIPDVGANFDVEQFTDELVECGVDFITWHARCNQGNAYYDTKIGYKHPSLKFDLFGKLCESCHRKGIKISAYLNGGISDVELLYHRDWMRVPADGSSQTNDWFRTTCYNSPFREHLKSMTRELAEKYHVDGFFFDCMGTYYTCVCPYCVEEMKRLGIDYKNLEEVGKFTRMSIIRLAKELEAVAKECNPQSFFFLNGSLCEEMIGADTQFECECLPPCKELGYDYLPVQAHYLRTIAEDHPVLCMTGRFYHWGDFGGLRKEESIEYDLFYGVANGMRPELADHYHPRGDFHKEMFALIKRIYHHLQEYDAWCLDAKNVNDIAVVYPLDPDKLRPDISLKAIVRMLTELKVQFDVVTMAASWSKYKLLIFPDNAVFSEECTRRVEEHIANGGKVIAFGDAGLDAEKKGFAVSCWPVKYIGPTRHKPVYYYPEGQFAEGLPECVLSVYASATEVALADGAKLEMNIVKPYHNQGSDGIHSNFYTPPQEKTEEPFLAVNDNIAYCAGELVKGYFERAPYQSRVLLGNLVKYFMPNLKFISTTMPSYSRAFVQYKDNMELLHLMCYTPELRGNALALEERGTLVNTDIAFRVDSAPIKKVYLAPTREEIPFTIENGYCRLTLPLLQGYALIVFEK